MLLKAVKGGTFKLANPKHERAQNGASIWSTFSVLTFLTVEAKCVYTCTKNFCVNASFGLFVVF